MKSVANNHQHALNDDRFEQLLATLSEAKKTNEKVQLENTQLRTQLDWFKRQIFGVKSERREHHPDQLALFASQSIDNNEVPAATVVKSHSRKKNRTGNELNETGLRFDSDVPIKEIILSCPELDGENADQYELIGYKESLRLASTPGTTVVLRYKRPIVKHKSSARLSQVAAPVGPLGHAQADVSFLAGMLVDKFVYHSPLYRQNQKLNDQGVTLSGGTLYNWTQQSISLLAPVAEATFAAILSASHIKIDETPIKAGRTKKINANTKSAIGRMKSGWLWPILGEHGDIAFRYSAS